MYLLTELVRLLETRGHTFAADPLLITERLRSDPSGFAERLHRRAAQIDADGALIHQLYTHRQRAVWLLSAATAAWFVLGFIGTYSLMRQHNLNFLFVLAGILGINTLMLLWWLASVWRQRPYHGGWLYPTLLFGRKPDAVPAALAELYAQTTQSPVFFWRASAVSHRLSLSALCGMFAAALLLLTVRQYTFNWESTLLDSRAFSRAVDVLGWLPSALGLPVPDADAVFANRNRADAVHAARWGGLLLGSIACYGILPRLLAWGVCFWQQRRSCISLDLTLPYYQNIIGQWQRRITDHSSDFRADAVHHRTPPHTPADQYWAVALDAPDAPATWFQNAYNRIWRDKGIVCERDDFHHFTEQLARQNQNIMLLIGIRARATPDRGTVRRLSVLAHHARGGLAIRLIGNGGDSVKQWQQICAEHGWHIV
ncbi:DUF2868 domain-containing protein [Conchiformibius steedae DSM 2580]|uniref:DUF2868 domain-containing protein n=1 Tax=Conchiformibius steedae DSM 2580 TaxID=1121352 RepID=A0AAE9HXJ5_9NEIS|nr:DUF2868 domain-containing protein [Conchiformibius steedae]QMT33868.1 DUF2868 domain-containing protein [Conchiformibius steedae]URD68531.1 DUF2868 domain-containing protein [Conchiformibius steedae DSM 2580]